MCLCDSDNVYATNILRPRCWSIFCDNLKKVVGEERYPSVIKLFVDTLKETNEQLNSLPTNDKANDNLNAGTGNPGEQQRGIEKIEGSKSLTSTSL